MSRAVQLLAALAVSAVGSPLGLQQTFRTGVDLVRIDVSVTQKEHQVTGLTAGDFRLTDNGVPQQIELASGDSLPLDVSLILDLSNEAFVHRRIGEFQADARRIAQLLKPQDRLRILADATYVSEVSEMQSPMPSTMVEALPKGGGTSTCDALTMALLVSPNAGRRHVIIDFTQAVDYLSVVDIGSVGRIAGRTDTLIHFVLAPTWTGGYGHGRPALPPTARDLIAIADTTGGTTQVLRSNVIDVVSQVVESVRNSYALGFTPRGVPIPGWHTVSVTLARPASDHFIVRARQKYYRSER